MATLDVECLASSDEDLEVTSIKLGAPPPTRARLDRRLSKGSTAKRGGRAQQASPAGAGRAGRVAAATTTPTVATALESRQQQQQHLLKRQAERQLWRRKKQDEMQQQQQQEQQEQQQDLSRQNIKKHQLDLELPCSVAASGAPPPVPVNMADSGSIGAAEIDVNNSNIPSRTPQLEGPGNVSNHIVSIDGENDEHSSGEDCIVEVVCNNVDVATGSSVSSGPFQAWRAGQVKRKQSEVQRTQQPLQVRKRRAGPLVPEQLDIERPPQHCHQHQQQQQQQQPSNPPRRRWPRRVSQSRLASLAASIDDDVVVMERERDPNELVEIQIEDEEEDDGWAALLAATAPPPPEFQYETYIEASRSRRRGKAALPQMTLLSQDMGLDALSDSSSSSSSSSRRRRSRPPRATTTAERIAALEERQRQEGEEEEEEEEEREGGDRGRPRNEDEDQVAEDDADEGMGAMYFRRELEASRPTPLPRTMSLPEDEPVVHIQGGSSASHCSPTDNTSNTTNNRSSSGTNSSSNNNNKSSNSTHHKSSAERGLVFADLAADEQPQDRPPPPPQRALLASFFLERLRTTGSVGAQARCRACQEEFLAGSYRLGWAPEGGVAEAEDCPSVVRWLHAPRCIAGDGMNVQPGQDVVAVGPGVPAEVRQRVLATLYVAPRSLREEGTGLQVSLRARPWGYTPAQPRHRQLPSQVWSVFTVPAPGDRRPEAAMSSSSSSSSSRGRPEDLSLEAREARAALRGMERLHQLRLARRAQRNSRHSLQEQLQQEEERPRPDRTRPRSPSDRNTNNDEGSNNGNRTNSNSNTSGSGSVYGERRLLITAPPPSAGTSTGTTQPRRQTRQPRQVPRWMLLLHRCGPAFAILGDASDNCAICRDAMVAGEKCRRLPCLHLFHARCLERWLRVRAVCPLDKTPLEDLLERGREIAIGPRPAASSGRGAAPGPSPSAATPQTSQTEAPDPLPVSASQASRMTPICS